MNSLRRIKLSAISSENLYSKMKKKFYLRIFARLDLAHRTRGRFAIGDVARGVGLIRHSQMDFPVKRITWEITTHEVTARKWSKLNGRACIGACM